MEQYELIMTPQFDHMKNEMWMEVCEKESGESLYQGDTEGALRFMWDLCQCDQYFTKRCKPQTFIVYGEYDNREYCESIYDETADAAALRFAYNRYISDESDSNGVVDVKLVVKEDMTFEQRTDSVWRESLMLFRVAQF